MFSESDLNQYRSDLIKRRNKVFASRTRLQEGEQKLHQPEIESAEEATKLNLSRTMEQLDDQERMTIEAIDRALGKLEGRSYGVCEACGMVISKKRLEAIPWTPYCIECADKKEKNHLK